MLLNKGKITEEMIRTLSAGKHSGFHPGLPFQAIKEV
jgi:hypothetical protein